MDVVTLGETMVLFTPNSTGMMRYADSFTKKFGGAESNVAIGLSKLGHKAGWISRVGDDEFGKAMVAFIRGEGVDVSQVILDSKASTGLYFKELRTPNEIRVTYYRSGSAASQMNPGDLNEEYISKAKYLHITGITPALSKTCYETVMEAIRIAKKYSVTIVFDPNLRKKLWSEERAREVLIEVASQSDIVLPGLDEAIFMFGDLSAEVLGKRFLDLGPSITVLKTGAKGAYFFTENESELVPGYKIEQVVDPVGAGDGFAAGVISGFLDGLSMKDSVKRGNAVGAMVTMVSGDVEGLPEKNEVLQFTNSKIEDIVR